MKRIFRASLWLTFICFPGPMFSQTFTLLKDIVSGSGGSNPTELTNANGILFFVATTAANGSELWKTDGTSSGTMMVKDIYPGTRGSNPESLTNLNGTLFFSADDGVYGKELWKSDGTEAGTLLVKDGVPGCCYANGDNFSNHLAELTISNGKLFFQARDHEHGTELWVSDGTESGTGPIDFFPGGPIDAPNNGNPLNLIDVNGVLYFGGQTLSGFELWKSDGTVNGTVLVKDINTTAGSNPSNFVNVDGTLYFRADDGINGNELWKSDGTLNGTLLVKDISTTGGSNPKELTNLNGTLYFVANAGIDDDELWKSNGTAATTEQVKDIFSGPGSGHPQFLTNVNGTLYFGAYDGAPGFELWKSNGTEAGTVRLKDIYSGSNSGSPAELTTFGSLLLFTAIDGINGRELWKSNGTEAGTNLLQDIESGGSGSSADGDLLNITESNGKLFITPTTSAYGKELWVYNPFVVLPLNSLDLRGHLVQTNNLLEWKTTNETNTSAFIVQRSLDGRTYIPVGTVAASGTSSVPRNYQFTDPDVISLGASVIYYRIQQKDMGGHYVFSKIISIPVNSKISSVHLYPNPVSNEFSLMFNVNEDENMQWQIVDNTGRILRQMSQQISAGSSSFGINVKGLAPGIYYLRIHSSSIQKQISFIKE